MVAPGGHARAASACLLLRVERTRLQTHPNVCFPGHGWVLTDKATTTIGGQVMNSMTAARGDAKFDVLYWLVGVLFMSRHPRTASLIRGHLPG